MKQIIFWEQIFKSSKICKKNENLKFFYIWVAVIQPHLDDLNESIASTKKTDSLAFRFL